MKVRGHVTLLVDRSGSMMSIKEEAEGGIRAFIEQQAALDGVKVTLSLYQFDDEYSTVYEAVKAKDAPAYALEPRGMTALYDAIGKAIEDTKRALAGYEKKPSKVVVVIMTDGAENNSKEYKFEAVTKLIDERKAAGWEFVFLAGSLEAVQFGRESGLRPTAFSPGVTGQANRVYTTAAAATASYLGGKTRSVEMPEDVNSGA